LVIVVAYALGANGCTDPLLVRARTGVDEDQTAKIDAFVEQGYTTNLWSNG